MKSINCHGPTKILKGKDALEQLCNECLFLGDKVLIVFSEDRIKQSGLYATVVSLLNISGIGHITYECKEKAFTEKEISEAVILGKKENVQLVLAIGDEDLSHFTKVVAHEVGLEILNSAKSKNIVNQHLPIINISAMLNAERRENLIRRDNSSLSFIQPAALFLDYEF